MHTAMQLFGYWALAFVTLAAALVLLNIYAKSSQPDFTRQVDGIPNEVSREANSNVLIPNGETVVLGGIFRNTANWGSRSTTGGEALAFTVTMLTVGYQARRAAAADRVKCLKYE